MTSNIRCFSKRRLLTSSCSQRIIQTFRQYVSTGPPIVHHDGYSCPWPDEHRFKMKKFLKVKQYLIEDCIVVNSSQWCTPDIASEQLLRCAHQEQYIYDFMNGLIPEKEMRKTGFHWTPGVVSRCRLEVGGTLLAAQLALEHGLACSTGGGTHHAYPDRGSGFCMFNDLAIVAEKLLQDSVLERVLIVDLDVHQGDGTAFICQDNPNIFTFSVHCGKNFPLRKQQSDLDISLERGMQDKEYIEIVHEQLKWLLYTFKPNLILYDAGVDPHKDDELGFLSLSDQGLFDRDELVLTMAEQYGVPVATVIGGGYCKDQDVLGRRHTIIHRAATKVWQGKRL